MDFKTFTNIRYNKPQYITIFSLTKRCGRHKKGTLVYLDDQTGSFWVLRKNSPLKRDPRVNGVYEIEEKEHENFFTFFVDFVEYRKL